MLAIASGLSSQPARPQVPYESHGACPFECCTYRTWTVVEDTDIFAERDNAAPVAFRVERGSQVEGLTGIVVTTKLGHAVVKRPTTIGFGSHAVAVTPGQDVFILHPVGEGYWRTWVRGRLIDEQLPDKGRGCMSESKEPVECAIQIMEMPETVWWAKVRSHSREGWTRELKHFGNIDACE